MTRKRRRVFASTLSNMARPFYPAPDTTIVAGVSRAPTRKQGKRYWTMPRQTDEGSSVRAVSTGFESSRRRH